MKNLFSLFFLCFLVACKPQAPNVVLSCEFIEKLKLTDQMVCGKLRVPENHNITTGKKIQIAYIILKAKKETANKFPLIYFSGGPGGYTLTEGRIKSWLDHPVREQRDIILFDQRGIGHSADIPNMRPALFEVMGENATLEEELQLTRKVQEEFRKKCKEQNIDLGNYNTLQNARDVGMLMEHLGYEKYNLYGGSYGTRLARVVQDLFPSYLHAVVLNSPSPLNGDFLIDRLKSYSTALERIFSYCNQQPDCRQQYPDLKKTYLEAIKNLEENPFTVDLDGKPFVINAQDGVYLIRRKLYGSDSKTNIPRLIKAFHESDTSVLQEIVEFEKNFSGGINSSMLLAVERFEQYKPEYSPRFVENFYKNLPLLPVRLGYFDAMYEAGRTWHSAVLPESEKRFKISSTPTLITVNQFDPVTPPENGYHFLKELTNGRLYILDEGGHGGGNADCRHQVMISFLDNPEEKPDTDCLNVHTSMVAAPVHQFNNFVEQMSASPGWGGLPEHSDFSVESFEKAHASTREQLKELRTIDLAGLSFNDQIDWKFAQSILVGRNIEQGQMKFWKKDPRRYMNFRSIANLIGGPGSPEDKLEELERRLKLVPQQLKNGQLQLEVFVPRFQELGLFMAEEGRQLFRQEIPDFLKDLKGNKADIKQLSEQSGLALDTFIIFLKETLPKLPVGDFAVGEPTYEAMLKGKFLLKHNAESLWDFGWREFRKTQAELKKLAKKIDPDKTWQELIVEIKNDYPHPDSMIQAHQYWVDKSRDHILENDLLPIPWHERVTVVPRARYLRKTSYYGNFSSAKMADDTGLYHSKWMINPFEHQWDEATRQQYMVEHDWGVIIVTAPHEAYGGHHVHGLYQMHNPSKLRRENGISLFSEGWGLYNEQLMQETGFFPNDRIHLRQLQLRLWRNARVIYDVGLHTGRLNYEEAIQLMEKEVGFLRWAAQLEIDAATSRPGYFIGYFLGMKEILAMREAYQKKMGANFNLKDFHVRLMEAGNMPTSLMREVLMKEKVEGK